MPKQKKYRWIMTAANTWQSNAERGYTGTISYNSMTQIYSLSIPAGSYTSNWTSLKAAKGDFRKYLLNKS